MICQLFNKKKWQCLAIRQHFFKLYFLYLIDPRFPDNGKIEFVFGPNQDAVVPGLFIFFIILAYLFNLNKIQVSFDVLKFLTYFFLMGKTNTLIKNTFIYYCYIEVQMFIVDIFLVCYEYITE